MILRRPFELIVARTFDAVVVAVRGPVNARRAGWLLEIVADLVDADDVVDLAVDLRHALVGGDAEVTATVAALADWRGVTGATAGGGVRQPQSLNPGGTACGHNGRFQLSLTPEEQVVRQREVMRFHPSGLNLATPRRLDQRSERGGPSTTANAQASPRWHPPPAERVPCCAQPITTNVADTPRPFKTVGAQHPSATGRQTDVTDDVTAPSHSRTRP
ncbi:MAG: hypothetical protein WKH68_07910 [Candidatus Limnocylindria bacterium]